jgi:hypothetical protein
MLRHVRLVIVPGLGTLHEDVGIGLEPARIVQGADAKSDKVGASSHLHIERRAAVAAEDADDVVTAVGLRDVAFWCSVKNAEPVAWEASGGHVCSAALALAVAAMAAQSEDRLAHGFVTNCATEAAACSGIGHVGLRRDEGFEARRRHVRNGATDPVAKRLATLIWINDVKEFLLERASTLGATAGGVTAGDFQ